MSREPQSLRYFTTTESSCDQRSRLESQRDERCSASKSCKLESNFVYFHQ